MSKAALWLRALLFGVAYFAGAWLGDWLTFQPSLFNTFWPNSGLFVAVLLLHPPRAWPFFVLAAVPANIAFDLFHGRPLWVTLLFSTGNCSEAVAGAWLVRRFCGGSFSLASMRGLLALIFGSALASTALSATFGTIAVCLAYGATPWVQWLKWWSSDVLGVLLVAPCIFSWLSTRQDERSAADRHVELLALVATVVVVSFLAFHGHCLIAGLNFVFIPAVVWAALRFGVAGVSLASAGGALIGVVLAIRSHTFAAAPDHNPWLEAVTLQGFLAVSTTLGLVLAILYRERMAAEALARQRTLDLERERRVHEDILEATLAGYWDWDIPGNTEYLSPALKRMFGYEDHELVNRPESWQKLVFAEDLPGVLEVFDRHVKSHGEVPYRREVRCRHKDGSTVWVLRAGRVIEWAEDGAAKRMVGCHIDITDRKRAEEALQQSESRYRTLFEQSGDYILLMEVGEDLVPVIIDMNSAAVRAHGYAREELLGKPITFLDPDSTPELNRQRIPALAGGNLSLFTVQHRRKDGTVFDVEVRAQTLRVGPKLLVVTSERDVTERRRLEERLRQSEKMDAIGQLAGGVAHDFNNQLAGVLGYADLLVRRIEDGPLKRYAENIKVAATRASDLTRQLLAFGRKGKYLSMPTDLHKVVAEVVELLSRSIDKRIEIHQHLDANPATVTGDPTQLQNAILNLALNARDAMPQGGALTFATRVVTVDVSAADADGPSGRCVQVSVTDTGIGMSSETQKHLFEPFFTTKEQGKGTGLGLASVYGAIRNHKGSVHLQSELGHGTTFTIRLPLPDALPVAVAPVTPDAAPQRSASILFIDDEGIVRDLVADMLRSVGHKVAACADGEEAVAFYREAWASIDLVILDMVMPKMNGRDTFLALRRINPKVKALLASGHSFDGEAQAVLDEGALGFVPKPFEQTELARKVAEALAS